MHCKMSSGVSRGICRNMESPYFEKEGHQSKKTGLLVISGDKGLAGAYNHNIMKMADTFLKDPSREVHLFVIGETGGQFFASKHIPIEENFQYTAQDPTFNRARWIAGILLERYLSGDLDEIHVLYTRMENVMQSVAKDKRVLPITKPDMHGWRFRSMCGWRSFPSGQRRRKR